MADEHFVVHLTDTEEVQPFKVFQRRAGAEAFATEKVEEGVAGRADLYSVPVDGRAAVEAVKSGKAQWASANPRSSAKQAADAERQAFDDAIKSNDMDRALKLLGL